MSNNWQWLPALPGLALGTANAAPVEGEFASNAAGLLVMLGVLAIIMGIRNLRLRRPGSQALRDRLKKLRSPAKPQKAPYPGR